MVIHMEDGQSPSQLVHRRSLFFTKILSTSYSKNDRINALLPSISLLRSCQENSFQKSHNLGFNFILQHMKKSNPRTSTPHLLFFSPPFFLSFPLYFFSSFLLILFKFFILLSHVKISNFSSKSSIYPIRDTPFKQVMKRRQGDLRGANSWCSTSLHREINSLIN